MKFDQNITERNIRNSVIETWYKHDHYIQLDDTIVIG